MPLVKSLSLYREVRLKLCDSLHKAERKIQFAPWATGKKYTALLRNYFGLRICLCSQMCAHPLALCRKQHAHSRVPFWLEMVQLAHHSQQLSSQSMYLVAEAILANGHNSPPDPGRSPWKEQMEWQTLGKNRQQGDQSGERNQARNSNQERWSLWQAVTPHTTSLPTALVKNIKSKSNIVYNTPCVAKEAFISWV